MANTILHKRSSTAGVTPAAGSLTQGELAINTADGKLFTKKVDGTVVEIGGGGGGGGGGGTMTVNTQDFTASGTWTKPANALWVEVTMCGAGMSGQDGQTYQAGSGGGAGRSAAKTFIAADLPSTVPVTCGIAQPYGDSNNASQSSFGTYVYASGPSGGIENAFSGSSIEATAANGLSYDRIYGNGGSFEYGIRVGFHGASFQGGGGGAGGDFVKFRNRDGAAGGQAATNQIGFLGTIASGGGGAGGATGNTGVAGSAGGFDPITGFGHGGGGGGEGQAGAGGNGGAAVRGGGGGGGGKGTTVGGLGGAGGNGFVRVRTMCFG
jgi:hypothetical protein